MVGEIERGVIKRWWTDGNRGSPVAVTVHEYDTGVIVATAEADKIRLRALMDAVAAQYPRHTLDDYSGDADYWIVTGEIL